MKPIDLQSFNCISDNQEYDLVKIKVDSEDPMEEQLPPEDSRTCCKVEVVSDSHTLFVYFYNDANHYLYLHELLNTVKMLVSNQHLLEKVLFD